MSQQRDHYIDVTTTVLVSYDPDKFTPEFLAEFRESFYDFKTVTEHLNHLARLAVAGVRTPCFIEGYGDSEELGIKLEITETF